MRIGTFYKYLMGHRLRIVGLEKHEVLMMFDIYYIYYGVYYNIYIQKQMHSNLEGLQATLSDRSNYSYQDNTAKKE